MSDTYTTTCGSCGHAIKPNYRECPRCEGRRNRDRVETLRKVIVELKQSPPRDAGEEKHALKRLHQLDHPFPEDFIKSITSAPEKSTRPSRRRAEDY